jgi:protein O-GlcNAc transferase
MEEKVDKFWRTTDFGYVKTFKEEMTTYCKSKKKGGSSLKCANNLRYCRAKNIYIDLRAIKFEGSKERFKENVFSEGDIGGYCELDQPALRRQGGHKSPLQSWYAELEQYTPLSFKPNTKKNCDVIMTRPVVFMKLDAGINMFHHFCDFVNLYASQHLNGSFSQDIDIIMWDTSGMGYGDFFEDTWKVFTKHGQRPQKLFDYKGKRLCIQDAMFPLLPRQRLGLFYNMPVVAGCSGSGLFKSFSDHTLRRLGIRQEGPIDQIRITLLDRKTKFRNILNQDELVTRLKTIGEYNITVIEYNWRTMSFTEQLQVTHNSDVFIGMHGAGLTHALFLPDWATLIELYNCEDERCYNDLARLRGVNYVTWEKKDKVYPQDEGKHPQTGGPHAKFTNYSFDVDEFVRLVDKAANMVKEKLGRS